MLRREKSIRHKHPTTLHLWWVSPLEARADELTADALSIHSVLKSILFAKDN
jgi:hypothetical protein